MVRLSQPCPWSSMVLQALRSQLWQAQDWVGLIAQCASSLLAEAGMTTSAADTLELAQLAEAIVPERRIAVSLYRRAYVLAADTHSIARARLLAQELGDFALMANLAELEYTERKDPRLLVVQALALLDANESRAAVVPLARCLVLFPDDALLPLLHRASSGDTTMLANEIRTLKTEAESEVGIVRAGLLLQAARLSRLREGHDADTLALLMQAFDACPRDESVFSLLENRLIKDQDLCRLANLYRIRAELAASKGREVEVYRRAGSRLLLNGSSKGLGLRLLREGVQVIYRRELEEGSSLIAMLTLVIEGLRESRAVPSAVRLLAQALAHPRSDDEVMWIVNNGIALADGDIALTRTIAVFQALRDRVLENNPEYLIANEEALEAGVLGEIDCELQELARPAAFAKSIAARLDVAVDVQIAARAELQLDSGPVEAMTRDLSSTGVFLTCRANLTLGENVRCKMMLPGEDDWSLVEHLLEGIVVRIEAGVGYGIRFDDVSQSYADDLQALHESFSG